MYQISSKSGDFSLRYDDLTNFKMEDVRLLNFMGPRMGCLKSPCKTSYWWSIETVTISQNYLVFEKISFFVYAFWRQTDRQIDGQRQCVKLPSLSRAAVAAAVHMGV